MQQTADVGQAVPAGSVTAADSADAAAGTSQRWLLPLLALHLPVLLVAALIRADAPSQNPLGWAVVYLLAVAGAATAGVLGWRGGRAAEQAVSNGSTSSLLHEAEQRRRQELSAVYATVARRSQALLERQIQVIEGLEQREEDPEVLRQLFALDHLATRMNRESASMLVLAGGEPDRRVVGTPPVSEVVRGAVAEIEDYTRVDLQLADDRDVDGRVVAPLVHLLSELIENAAAYSPPGTRVAVHGTTAADGGYVLRIVDRGIGLDDQALDHHNRLLAQPPSGTPTDNQRLGLDVVARLVGRLGLPARLAHNDDGPGITAVVVLPAPLLGAAAEGVLDEAPDAPDIPVPAELAEPAAPPPPAVGTGSPRWTSATRTGTSTPAPVVPAAAAAEEAPVPVAVGATAGQVDGEQVVARSRPSAAPPAAASGPSASWSYSGHLRSRGRSTTPSDPETPRRGGRGSRSQISGPAPRPLEPTGPEGGGDLAGILDAHRSEPRGASWAAQRSSAAPSWPDRPAVAAPAASTGGTTPGAPAQDRGDVTPQPAPSATEPADAAAPADAPAGPGDSPASTTAPAGAPALGATPPPSAITGQLPPGAGVDTAAGTTRGGLPRRARGAALPPALKDPDAVASPRNPAMAPVSREESRSLLSSYQTRLQAGRRAAEEQVAKSTPAQPQAQPDQAKPDQAQAGQQPQPPVDDDAGSQPPP